MQISSTLSVYIGRQFLMAFAAFLLAFLGLILMLDTIELLRRVATKSDIGFGAVLEMALLKLPHLGQETFHFAVLFGGMLVFWRLTRNHELTVTCAAGVSAWQFLLPVVAIASVLGTAKVAVVNPFAAALLSRYQRDEAIVLEGQQSYFAISDAGVWLRQAGDTGQSVVHAKRVVHKGPAIELHDVIVFNYEGNNTFASRVDAAVAALELGQWRLTDAWIITPEERPRFVPEYRVPTDLTVAKIQDSFAPPETMSFWSLPAFIRTLEAAGFSALRHRLHFHALLATPLLMCAMVLIGATFTLRQSRRGGTTFIIVGGVLAGFMVHVFSDVIFAFGLSDRIPVALAAWAPSGIATLLGLATLLHLEDG